MKVLFLTTSYPVDEDDPRGNHVRVLARRLAADGDDITVVCPSPRGSSSTTELEGVGVHRYAYWPGGGTLTRDLAGIMPALRERPARLLQVPPLLAGMYRAARRHAEEANIIHAHWLFPSGNIAAILGRRTATPVVITAHGADANLAARWKLLGTAVRHSIASSEYTMAVSEAIARSLSEGGSATERILVAPLGVDDHGTASPDPTSVPLFLFVGSLTHRKGVDILLDAADLVHEAHGRLFRITMVGDGPLSVEVKDRAARNPIVEWIGAQPPSRVSELLLGSSGLVLPSRSEGRPFAVMEAMSAALPVVATNIPGIRELVANDTTGILCESNARSIADALVSMAKDPELRTRMGRAGRSRLLAEGLTSAEAAERVRTIYSAAIRDSSIDGPHSTI